MKIQILHIDDCPNWKIIGADVVATLHELGASDVPVEYQLLTTSAEAAEVPFAGSPTLLIDGVDAFPSAGGTSSLACRIYVTDAGMAGVPSRTDLRRVLGQVLDAREVN